MLRRHHILRRRLADPLVRALILLQCLATMPEPAQAQAETTAVPPAFSKQEAKETAAEPETPVTVNRTRPAITAPVLTVQFDETPSSVDLARARVLPVPLRPAGGLPSLQENRDLGRALEAFAVSRSLRQLEEFAARYPQSPWRASLLINLGRLKWQEGYFSRATAMWDEAWQLTKDSTERGGRDLAEIAVSEWLTGEMTFGQVAKVQQKLDEIGRRPIGGPAGNKVTEAREGLWQLTNHHEMAVYSGPEALKALMAVTGKSTSQATKQIDAYHAPHMGTSLVALRDLAKEAGVALEMRYVEDATDISIPSIVHLKSEHYSAVIARRGDGFVLRDPALGGEMLISRNALRDEASGYILALASSRRSDGRAIDEAEARRVVGHCHPGIPVEAPCNCLGETATGMPAYTLHPLMAAVVITDTPLSYVPPRGPTMSWTFRYNHRSTRLGSLPTSGNVGPLWSFDWLSYVQDNNTMVVAPFAWTDVVLRGESIEKYTSFGGPTHFRSRATLVPAINDPPRYERQLPDGTVEVFTFPDRAASLPNRKIFLTQLIDQQGNTVTLTYDSSARLVAVTDAVGQVTTVSYENPTDPLLITKITDPFGRTALLGYDSAGRLSSITDAVGMMSTFAYDETDFMTSMTTPYGTTTFRRGPDSLAAGNFRRVEATDPEGGTERLEYHLGTTTGMPAQVAPGDVPAGFEAWNQEMDQYNSLYWSKQAMAVAPGALSSAVITKWLLYPEMAYQLGHAWDIPHSVKRPLQTRVWYRYPDQSPTVWGLAGTGTSPTMIARVLDGGATQLSQYTYNARGMVTSATDPLGRHTIFSYATNGIDLLEVRRGTDLLVSYGGYNAYHLPATMTDAAGQTTTTTYNAGGSPLTITNAKNETTTFVYDSGPTGYLLSMTGPISGATTSFTYDAYGRPRTVSDADGYTVTTDYDGLDRLTKQTFPDGTFEQLTYQRLNIIEERDRKGRVSRHYYDGVGRLVATRDTLGRVTSQNWCICGELEAVIDAKGQRTSWEHNVLGNITREVRADGTTDALYSYDSAGRLKTITDSQDQVATYTYLADNSLSSTTYTNASVATAGVSYTYDSAYSRVIAMIDGSGTTTYTYKAPGQHGAGQVATVDGPLTNDLIDYSYDELGRVTTRAINGTANTVIWSFDALDRVTTEVNMLGTFTYGYDGVSQRLVAVTYPNGQTSAFSYLPNNQDHRLQTIHHKYPGGATLSRFDYTYDIVGNIQTLQDQFDGNPAAVWTYGYDSADQVILATKQTATEPSTSLKRYAYGYDPAGNRSFEQIDNAVTLATHHVTNRLMAHTAGGPLQFRGTLSEPASVTIQGVPAIVDSMNAFRGSSTMASGISNIGITAVDAAGNQATRQYQVSVSGRTNSFTYDANGNMTSDGTRAFEWDGANRLIGITDGVLRYEFSYDGLGRRSRATRIVSGVSVSDTQFVWCDWRICEERAAGSGEILRRDFVDGYSNGGVPRFYARDQLGSITEVLGSSATVLARYRYDPFGRQTVVDGSELTDLGFAGLATVEDASVVLAPMRAYDPNLGRWLSEDPAGVVDGPNRYGYVGSNPIRYVDPMGLQAQPAQPAPAPRPIPPRLPGRVIPFPRPVPPAPRLPLGGIMGGIIGGLLIDLLNPTSAGEGSDLPVEPGQSPDIGPQRCLPYRKTNRGCTCFVACNIEAIDSSVKTPKIYPKHANGIGTGNNCNEAKANAEKSARAAFAAWTGGRETGLKTKHCHPLWCKDH